MKPLDVVCRSLCPFIFVFVGGRKVMLRPRALSSILGQANTGGVKATCLLNREGNLVAYSGMIYIYHETTTIWNDVLLSIAGQGDSDTRVSSAISSYIWSTYDRIGHWAFDSKSSSALRCLLLDFSEGRVAIRAVTPKILLCMFADQEIPLGLIKAKLKAIAEYLETPLTVAEQEQWRTLSKIFRTFLQTC